MTDPPRDLPPGWWPDGFTDALSRQLSTYGMTAQEAAAITDEILHQINDETALPPLPDDLPTNPIR